MKHECGITPENIESIAPDQVFVFGSNLAGHHGAGAAYAALQWGAVLGLGEGLSGQTYALPTKDENINTLSITHIKYRVARLLECVKDNPNMVFLITKVGCGLAGLSVYQIAPLFSEFVSIPHCTLPQDFLTFLEFNK